MPKMRLQKYLAQCGLGSRRKCEEYIVKGHVKINNHAVTELGTTVDPHTDTVHFLNQLVKPDRKIYLVLNKPKDYITTRSDEFGRKTVYDLLPPEFRSLHPVGRLDRNSTGLLLLTNDGELTQSVLHPKNKINKTYRVTLDKTFKQTDAFKFAEGILIEDQKTLPAKVLYMDDSPAHLEVTIYEGRNRQVRKMFEALGYDVIKLKRIKIANLELGKLKLSEYRLLNEKEIERFKKWIQKK
ncbi:MAG: pseudouridine synthase [Candidatus Margulisbacteria bacterium]|nr:pseudouridine synthase [Candidatus Margulisiibacteriota bacterium]